MSEHIAWVLIPGKRAGARIGIVKLNESGYYRTDYDREGMSEEDAQSTVDHMNSKLGVPKEVAKSAADGSMFGWTCPAARPAIEFFKEQAEADPSNPTRAIHDNEENYWDGD